MNRHSHLMQQIHGLIKQKRAGAPHTKKTYAYVLRKILNSLQQLHCLPPDWGAINNSVVHRLVQYWLKEGDRPKTIQNRLSILRNSMATLPNACCLQETKFFIPPVASVPKTHSPLPPFDVNRIHDLIIRTIVEFELQFGLTKVESMLWSFTDGLGPQEATLIIHRTLSNTTYRRDVPVITAEQYAALMNRRQLLATHHSLLNLSSLQRLLKFYNAAMAVFYIDYPLREHYINQRYQQLLQEQSEKEAVKLLLQETGFTDKRTLKGHLWSI